jgi:hypothetical protein
MVDCIPSSNGRSARTSSEVDLDLASSGPIRCATLFWMNLRQLFARPACKRCASGVLRPIDVVNNRVQIRCTTRGCAFATHIRLPILDRKIVYLDTANVSHIARAASKHEPGPYRRLHQALGEAVSKNVIGCVTSSVLHAEVQLFRDPQSILAVCRELGAIRPYHELHVQEAQIYRAFGRFLRSEPAVREIRPPRDDAFDSEVNAWHGVLSFHTQFPTPPAEIVQRRETKQTVGAILERVYGAYAAENLAFRNIERRESDSMCLLSTDPIFYKLVCSREFCGIQRDQAEREVREFLFSDHVRQLPFSVINAKLHAALAVAFRNTNARRPKPSDAGDIEHFRAYLPYVDVFVTDTYMASVATQGNVGLNKEYGVQVRSLRKSEVDSFIAWLKELTAASSTAVLSARIYDAISTGGYFQEFAEFASQYVSALRRGA